MNVVYYGLPAFLDHIPLQLEHLCRRAEVDVVLEVSPRAWSENLLDLPLPRLGPGLHDGRDYLHRHLPAPVNEMFAGAARVLLAVYPAERSQRALRTFVATAAGIRRLRPDLIHFEGESPRASWAPLLGVPWVASVHEPPLAADEGHLRTYGYAKRLPLPRARHLIVHSEEARRMIAADPVLRGVPVTVIPLGCTGLYRFWPSRAAEEHDGGPTVVFRARLTEGEGLDVCLAAAPSVAAAVPGVRFVVAGRPHPEVRPGVPTELANGGRLEVHASRLPPGKLADLLRVADIVLVPSRHARQSGVVLSAYAFGAPVIASDIGVLSEQVVDGTTGLLVPPGDAGALAAAIVDLLADAPRRQAMRRAVDTLCASALSWERYAERVVTVYAAAVCPSTGAGNGGRA